MTMELYDKRSETASKFAREALFAGFPVSVLTLIQPEAGPLDALCRRLELVVNSGASPDIVHVTCETLRPGQHKTQAVRLFAAVLVLANGRQTPTGVLHEFSQLHANLAIATGQSSALYSREARAHSVGWRSSCVRIAVPTLWHLKQAGYQLPESDSAMDVTADELRRLFVRFVSEMDGHHAYAGAAS